jgi:hypothetical protein
VYRTILCAAAALFIASQAVAQQKVSFKVPTEDSKFIVSQNADVEDVPNHIVRLFNTRNTITDHAATINGLKLVEVFVRGTGDLINLYGAGHGYFVFVAENGDKFFASGNFVSQNAGGKVTATTWIAQITGGTGKFAGIQGIARQLVNVDPNPGGVISGLQFDIEYSIGK